MKTILVCNLLFLSLSLIDLPLAQEREPLIVSPLIGEQLDRVERDYFKLFPQFNGFQEAVYYLNADSSVSVNVIYEDAGVIKDTLMERSKNIKTLSDYIDNVILDKIRNDKITIVNLIFSDGSEAEERLFYVNNQYIYTLNHTRNGSKYLHQDSNGLNYNYIPITNIYRVKSVESVSTQNYMIYGCLIGAGLGLMTGLLYTDANPEDHKGSFGGVGQAGDVFISTAIGAAVGSLTGFIIALTTQKDDITIILNSPGGLAELRKYVLYQE